MFRVTFIVCSFVIAANAAVPRSDVPETQYQELWKNSPFTSRPAAPVTVEPLKEYALGGISKLDDGYFAILLNRKKPDEKIVIYPGRKNEFEVLDVKWPGDSWRDAVVTVGNGSYSGVVKFDEKLLSLKSAAAPTPRNSRLPMMPDVKSSTPTETGNRTPRPRISLPNK